MHVCALTRTHATARRHARTHTIADTNAGPRSTNMTKADLKRVLTTAKEAGIQNILALRGDPPKGKAVWERCEAREE